MPLSAPRFRQRRLAMTSLIDVIFLLLMYFMLATTFTRFAEVKLMSAGTGVADPSALPPRFVQVSPIGLTLNGEPVGPDDLATRLGAGGGAVLVALKGDVTSETLARTLARLQAVGGLDVRVLEN